MDNEIGENPNRTEEFLEAAKVSISARGGQDLTPRARKILAENFLGRKSAAVFLRDSTYE